MTDHIRTGTNKQINESINQSCKFLLEVAYVTRFTDNRKINEKVGFEMKAN